MKNRKRYRKTIALTAAALSMMAAVTAGNAMAYFTTYVEAGGGQTISLGADTSIEENVESMVKHVTIFNTSENNDCVVRVKVLSGSKVQCSPEGPDWIDGGDGFWYYNKVLTPKGTDGGRTSVLNIAINADELSKEDGSFNVVVVQECAPPVYEADGNLAIFTADGKANPECWEKVYTNWQEYKDITGKEAGN